MIALAARAAQVLRRFPRAAPTRCSRADIVTWTLSAATDANSTSKMCDTITQAVLEVLGSQLVMTCRGAERIKQRQASCEPIGRA
jgi:hypothetical protein